MSRWGEGILENDTAADWLIDYRRKIIAQLQSNLFEMRKDPKLYYEYFSDESVVGIVSVLHLLILEVDLAPPEPPEIRYWRKEFMRCWKKAIPEEELGEKTDYFSERSIAIKNTFDSLLGMSREFWDDKPIHQQYVRVWQSSLMAGGALGFVSNLIAELKAYIVADLDALTQHNDNDFILAERVLVSTYIIKLLVEKVDIEPPNDKDVLRWKNIFIRWWRAYNDYNNNPAAFDVERYEIIEKLFDELIELSKSKKG